MIGQNYSKYPDEVSNFLVRFVKCDSDVFSRIGHLNFQGCLIELATLNTIKASQI